MERKILQLEQDLDEMENILCVEWSPPEVAEKKEQRLKLQKQYEPPSMSLIDRYHTMLRDANGRVESCAKEIEILKEIAKDKAPLKHLRKYIDPEQPSIEELNQIILDQKLQSKKLETRIKNWKQKCNAFDQELEKSKTTLMELRIRYQTLKRMKCHRMAKMQRAKRRISMVPMTSSLSDPDNHQDRDHQEDNDNESVYMLQIEELETKLMIANEQIKQFKMNQQQNKQLMDDADSESMEELQIQFTLLQTEMKEKNEEMMIIKTQLKDATLKLNESYEQIEELKVNHKQTNPKPTQDGTGDGSVINHEEDNQTILHLKEKLRNSQIEIEDLSDELKERNTELKQLHQNVSDGGDGSESMLQQYMKANEALKKELRHN
eukprot:788654_1